MKLFEQNVSIYIDKIKIINGSTQKNVRTAVFAVSLFEDVFHQVRENGFVALLIDVHTLYGILGFESA